ncbi:type II toxin-antitoxin system PemK/MazF family toxin [Marinibaculum pumilum]|uniref:Type II toxin-antitoxin system PemK/MazF family toxin n=1 Tax=Marinibaculum pumilum TaxID=1766165 RepID=A0ABV7L902_9PROT
MTPDRGDLVWVEFNPQSGHEQAGRLRRRPAVVISPAAYNALSNCILVCPITSNRSPWAWKVLLPDEAAITGAVLVDQIKAIDAKARRLTPAGHRLTPPLLAEVLARLATLTG